MKVRTQVFILVLGAVFLAASTSAWGAKGGIPGKPPPNEDPPPETPIEDFYFWRLGHMDGPHDSAKALGISRDGKVAVRPTVVVNYLHAWRCDIDWAIATDDGVPPLYNELQVQEDIGVIAPSRPSAAYAASDLLYEPRKVQLGVNTGTVYEVLRGLQRGEEVVTQGSFLLKTEILKGSIGAGCCEVQPGA